MAKQFSPLEYSGFTGGLNKDSDMMALDPTELRDAVNVRIGDKGEIQRRPGYRQYSVDLASPQHFLHYWLSPANDMGTFTVDEWGKVFKGNTTTFDEIGDLGKSDIGDLIKYPVGFASGEGYLYITTLRQGHVKRWDGAELIDLDEAADPIDDDDETVYLVPPVAQHIAYRHGRLYLGNTSKNTSRIWFSAVLDPGRFDEEAWVDLDPEDGTWITSMVNYGDELIVFKNNSLWELTGRDPTTYTLRTIDRLRGTVSPKTVCQMRGMLVFFDRDSGIWGYDGSQLTLLSEKINNYILLNQAYSRAGAAAAYFGDHRLYVSIPWLDGSNHTFVLNANNGAWAEYDSGFYVGAYHLQNRFMSVPDTAGLLIADGTEDTIAGETYRSAARTGWVEPLGPGTKARLRRMELVVDGVEGAMIRVQIHPDMSTATLAYKDARIPSRSGPHRMAYDGWGGNLHSIQFSFQLFKPVELSRFTAMFSGRRELHGERT